MSAKVHRIDPEDCVYSWWFRNPANQLRLVGCPIIYMVLFYTSQVVYIAGFLNMVIKGKQMLAIFCVKSHDISKVNAGGVAAIADYVQEAHGNARSLACNGC